MKKAKIIASAPLFIVNNVEKSVEFYTSKIGFSLIGIIGSPAAYGMITRNKFQIHFQKTQNETTHSNFDLVKNSYDLILWIPEIDSFYNELLKNNVTIIEGIRKKPYGSREFIFQDIDGHTILVGD